MTAAKPATKPKSYLDSVTELVENICTGCIECGDRDTCECNFDEDLAFEADPDDQPAANLRPRAVAATAR